MIRRAIVAMVGFALLGALGFSGHPTGSLAAPKGAPSVFEAARADAAGLVIHLVEQPNNADAQYAFSPASATVPVGTTVQWVNDAPTYHTITSMDGPNLLTPNGLYDQSVASAGDTFSFTFTTPGTYFYYCAPHADFMTGTITVTG